MKITVSNHETMPEKLSFAKRPDNDLLFEIENYTEYSDYNVYVSEFVEKHRSYFQDRLAKSKISCIDSTFPDFFLHKIAIAFSQFADMEQRKYLYAEERKMVRHLTENMREFVNDDYTIYKITHIITQKIVDDANARVKHLESLVNAQEEDLRRNRKQLSSISELAYSFSLN